MNRDQLEHAIRAASDVVDDEMAFRITRWIDRLGEELE